MLFYKASRVYIYIYIFFLQVSVVSLVLLTRSLRFWKELDKFFILVDRWSKNSWQHDLGNNVKKWKKTIYWLKEIKRKKENFRVYIYIYIYVCQICHY